MANKTRVSVNGYGVIGKRVADAVRLQPDMELLGIADVVYDYRIRTAAVRGIPVYASLEDKAGAMRSAGLTIAGTFQDLLHQSASSWIARRKASAQRIWICTEQRA
jgi:glyceraldehyde-3-phosphate dehydrogenase (NAD(P))